MVAGFVAHHRGIGFQPVGSFPDTLEAYPTGSASAFAHIDRDLHGEASF
jgi:hypothetical protein